jgi:glycerate dehydrogenase
MNATSWGHYGSTHAQRVLVTRRQYGERWLPPLISSGCRVVVHDDLCPLSGAEIRDAIGDRCDGVVAHYEEAWDEALLEAFACAGGRVLSTCAAGLDNIDVGAATSRGIAVGTTPHVYSETTAEFAVALALAAARHLVEAHSRVSSLDPRAWAPGEFTGQLLKGKKLGIIGAGRIGSACARILVEGHGMNLIYFGRHANSQLEQEVRAFAAFLKARDREPVSCRRAKSLEELLLDADIVSIHAVSDATTYHLIDVRMLGLMKDDAILVNTSRGSLIDEEALIRHCRRHPQFHACLDVFEQEPLLSGGLLKLPNVVSTPHVAGESLSALSGSSMFASLNVAAVLAGWPVWVDDDLRAFCGFDPPQAAPSIINWRELRLRPARSSRA